MKRKLIYAIVFTILFYSVAFAEGEDQKDWELSVKGIYSIYMDKELSENGKGVKAEVRWKYVYLWGSWEETELRLTGQRAGSIGLYGVGLGGKANIWGPLRAFLEVGYYIPNSDMAKNPMSYSEGIYYKWYRTLNEIGHPEYATVFTDYKYELKSGLGGSIGLEINQNIYKGICLNISGAYRYLNLKEDWDAYNPNYSQNPSQGLYIQTKEKRDFSGGVFNVGVTYRF